MLRIPASASLAKLKCQFDTFLSWLALLGPSPSLTPPSFSGWVAEGKKMLQLAWPLSQNGQVDRFNSTHQPLTCQIVQHKNTLCCFLFQNNSTSQPITSKGSDTFSALVRFVSNA